MPGGEATRHGYTYPYHRDEAVLDEARTEASRAQDLRYVRDTILLLTGGCEVCQHSVGPYCKKQGRPIKPGDPRCEYFARRLPDDPREASRAQVERFVNESLGVADQRYARRLTGSD